MEFSFRATYQYGFVWIFDQYGFQYGYEFKSCYSDVKLNLLSHISQCNFVCCFIQSYLPLKFCPFKSRCPIETFPAYLKMKYCLLFHLKLWIFEKNSSFVFKSRCQIESFSIYLTMKSCLLFQSKLWIFDKNSSLLNLLSHILQYNPVYSFIQSYEFLKRIQVLFLNCNVKLNLFSHISQRKLVCSFIQS